MNGVSLISSKPPLQVIIKMITSRFVPKVNISDIGAVFAGILVGSLFWGLFADRFGRRLTFL